jgi:hypothetical protein
MVSQSLLEPITTPIKGGVEGDRGGKDEDINGRGLDKLAKGLSVCRCTWLVGKVLNFTF